MTEPLDLDELERLEKARTQGPFVVSDILDNGHLGVLTAKNGIVVGSSGNLSKENADYIVAACNSLPALLVRVRQAENARDYVKAAQESDQRRAERLANENGTLKDRVRELEAAKQEVVGKYKFWADVAEKAEKWSYLAVSPLGLHLRHGVLDDGRHWSESSLRPLNQREVGPGWVRRKERK